MTRPSCQGMSLISETPVGKIGLGSARTPHLRRAGRDIGLISETAAGAIGLVSGHDFSRDPRRACGCRDGVGVVPFRITQRGLQPLSEPYQPIEDCPIPHSTVMKEERPLPPSSTESPQRGRPKVAQDEVLGPNHTTPQSPEGTTEFIDHPKTFLRRRRDSPDAQSLADLALVAQHRIQQPGQRMRAGAQRSLALRRLLHRSQLIGNVQRRQHRHA